MHTLRASNVLSHPGVVPPPGHKQQVAQDTRDHPANATALLGGQMTAKAMASLSLAPFGKATSALSTARKVSNEPQRQAIQTSSATHPKSHLGATKCRNGGVRRLLRFEHFQLRR